MFVRVCVCVCKTETTGEYLSISIDRSITFQRAFHYRRVDSAAALS